jgi:predicted NBD/HSP70 family sugar kinase
LYLSGPGLQRDHAGVTGEQLAPSDIDARANAGCLQSESTLQRYERRLAQSLAQVINILDPDVIVLGGGLSNIGRWYTTVPRLWGEWVFSDIISTRLVKNRHGDSSGVRGAAWLWPL